MDLADERLVRQYLSEHHADYICSGCGEFRTGLCAINDRGTPYCSDKCLRAGVNHSAMQMHMRFAGLRRAALSQEGE